MMKGVWPKNYLGMDVFEASVNRMVELYAGGHRIVVSMSGGKDSTIAFEVCRIAARETNRLPVEVVMRDDEIMYPGTFEYLERVAADPEVDFTWLVSHWPQVNIYNRVNPFIWPYDPDLPQGAYVQPMSPRAQITIWPWMTVMTNRIRYPPARGKNLYAVIGIRAAESIMRRRATYASGGHLTAPKNGVINCKPIYDWMDRDVWRAIREFEWDYNRAYDYLASLGVPKPRQRVAPPISLAISAPALLKFATSHPEWFARVEARCGPGLTQYRETKEGSGLFMPRHFANETWEETFWRECVDKAPVSWISERASILADKVVRRHEEHSIDAFPDDEECFLCDPLDPRNWRDFAYRLYYGDPEGLTSLAQPIMDAIGPDGQIVTVPWRTEIVRRGPMIPTKGEAL